MLRDKGNYSATTGLDKYKKHFYRYFSGKAVDFRNYQIDFTGYTDFEISVLEETRKIPYGKTKTYADIAKAIGKPKAARAVGNALGKNRTPILIPCHRVIKSDGSPGGFSMGLEWKKKLLKLEGIR